MKMVNKYNLPIIVFAFGMIFSLLLAVVGGVFFKSAYWGTLGVGVTCFVALCWYIGLGISTFLGRRFGKTQQDNQSQAISQIHEDDDFF